MISIAISGLVGVGELLLLELVLGSMVGEAVCLAEVEWSSILVAWLKSTRDGWRFKCYQKSALMLEVNISPQKLFSTSRAIDLLEQVAKILLKPHMSRRRLPPLKIMEGRVIGQLFPGCHSSPAIEILAPK